MKHPEGRTVGDEQTKMDGAAHFYRSSRTGRRVVRDCGRQYQFLLSGAGKAAAFSARLGLSGGMGSAVCTDGLVCLFDCGSQGVYLGKGVCVIPVWFTAVGQLYVEHCIFPAGKAGRIGSRYSGFAGLADWHAAAVSENSAACGMAESALFVLDGVCLLFKHWNLDAESLTGFLSVRRIS